MNSITCPRCGVSIAFRRTLSPGLKPFCARCGWNLERAEKAMASKSSTMKYIPIGLAVLGIFGAMAAFNGKSAALFFILAAIGAVLLIPFWGYFSTQKAIAAAKLTVNSSLAQSQPPINVYLQQLQVMSRPRRVKFRFQSTFVVALIMCAAIAVAFVLVFAMSARRPPYTGNHSNGSPAFVLAVLLPLVFMVVLVVPFFRDRRKIPLLRDGELALGRVSYQENFRQGKSSYSRIGYEFKTSSGQLVQDHAKDLTFSVFEEMTIPVFYDPLNPSKNVTPCATYLQVSMSPY